MILAIPFALGGAFMARMHGRTPLWGLVPLTLCGAAAAVASYAWLPPVLAAWTALGVGAGTLGCLYEVLSSPGRP